MKKLFTVMVVMALGALSFVAFGPASHAEDGFSDAQKKEIGSVIRDYILENPGLLMEALEKKQRDEMAVEEKRFEDFMAKNAGSIADGAPFAGNPDADVVIVEFFDYNCGYCKRALADVVALLEEDKNLKVVFRDMPILSPGSHEAALWAMAAGKQGKYYEFHQKLMNKGGSKSTSTFEMVAKELGLDVDQMKKDIKDKAFEDQIAANMKLAQEMGIRGTPAFIIGDRLSRGYLGVSSMKKIIADVRAQ